MIDAVLSYHLNPYTCGVAKFNHRLARELGVPCVGLGGRHRHALISIKASELPEGTRLVDGGAYSLFLHDAITDHHLLRSAERVYAANGVIADAVRSIRPDVIAAWCPSTVDGNATRGTINVLTFGMAHKLTLPYYEQLKALLGATGKTYTVGLSCAVHEGNPWDQQMEDTERRMRALFGSHLRVLGYLGDDALVREIDQATAVAAFYDPALRANNTSAWAVIERERPLITNLDEHSPDVAAYDITEETEWPSPLYPMKRRRYERTWEQLLSALQVQPCAK